MLNVFDYVYVDHKQKGEYIHKGKKYSDGNIVFVALAVKGILEADQSFEESIGKNPCKINTIGCFWEPSFVLAKSF